jgi:atypical dual specificity phosphatase
MVLPRNFSWLLPGQIAGSACPGSEAELRGLVAVGVSYLVTLSAADALPPACVTVLPGLAWTSLVIPEFRGPDRKAWNDFFKVCETARTRGEGVAVHCRVGRGRTGTFLAAYLMRYAGLSAREAVAAVRRCRPGSVETRHQEEALESLEKTLTDARSGPR